MIETTKQHAAQVEVEEDRVVLDLAVAVGEGRVAGVFRHTYGEREHTRGAGGRPGVDVVAARAEERAGRAGQREAPRHGLVELAEAPQRVVNSPPEFELTLELPRALRDEVYTKRHRHFQPSLLPERHQRGAAVHGRAVRGVDDGGRTVARHVATQLPVGHHGVYMPNLPARRAERQHEHEVLEPVDASPEHVSSNPLHGQAVTVGAQQPRHALQSLLLDEQHYELVEANESEREPKDFNESYDDLPAYVRSLQNSPAPSFVVDGNMRIVLWSDGMYHATGLSGGGMLLAIAVDLPPGPVIGSLCMIALISKQIQTN